MIKGYLEKLVNPFPEFYFELQYSNQESIEWYGETSCIDLKINDYEYLPF